MKDRMLARYCVGSSMPTKAVQQYRFGRCFGIDRLPYWAFDGGETMALLALCLYWKALCCGKCLLLQWQSCPVQMGWIWENDGN
jgi:hypothetical protein